MSEQKGDRSQRPSPDALLAAARREDRRIGRLRIFVGAAPGVGKTYEMLLTARARIKDGYDVVVGVVETHGRKETEALLDGLETIPRRSVEYKGQSLDEMDLDAILVRRPQIALVDELAHTNAAGSRHPKRYLDVQELLNNGIDVYTTVNIQHIESLNDVVAQITHVRVRETVPDSIFDRADSVELVDLTPEDLIQRLKEGKIYVPKQAERALEHFFSPANLTALRELALRRTADRVDEQLLNEMQSRAISGPWAAGERVLVCVSEDPRTAGLVRYTKRLADRLHAPWTALYIESRRSASAKRGGTRPDRRHFRLAQSLGGEPVTIPGSDRGIAENIIAYAQAYNVTQIIIGKSSRSRWFEMLHGSVVHDLVRRAGNISVHVIAGEEISLEPIAGLPCRPPSRRNFDPWPYVVCGHSHRGCARGRLGDPALARHRECRSGFSDRDRRHCSAVRTVAVTVRQRDRVAWLQFLLHGAGLHVHDRRSDQCRGVLLFHRHGGARFECCGARSHPGGDSHGSRAHDRSALQLQPQARRRRYAGRRALGDGLSDRLDAEGPGRAAAARRTARSSSRPAIRPKIPCRTADIAAAKWAFETTGRPGAVRRRCRERSACFCRCRRAAASWASWVSTATSRELC